MLTQNPPLRRSRSSDDFHSSERKRRRKALSCYDCRRRKLRCDREYPSCGRCRKAGQAHSCIYESGPLEHQDYGNGEKPGVEDALPVAAFGAGARGAVFPTRPNAEPTTEPTSVTGKLSPETPSSKLVQQARRIAQLESRLASLEASQPTATWQSFGEVESVAKPSERRHGIGSDPFLTSPRGPSQPETILFRGKNYKTQYYGGTNPTSLIAHFPELRCFMKEAITHHASLSRVQRDLKVMQVSWKTEKADFMHLRDMSLPDLLPARETVDHLVHLYFDTFETAYRILHAPTFWSEYQSFWEDQQAAKPSFIVIILLAMAAVNCVSSREQPTYIGDSATARESAIVWIEACGLWLERQSQKHVYLAIWQIRCLMLLARLSNAVKKKRAWTSAGNLMRQAMSAGFHRDPSLLGAKVSVFDQEMRRRLWATMVELELQASIDRGMPSASAGLPSDVAPVLNVNDEDFGEDSQKSPSQKPWDDYTATSFLHISRSSLSLRISLNSLLNELSSQAQYEDVLIYDEKIAHKLQEIPVRTGCDAGQEGPSIPELTRTLLDVQLRQFLILIHGPFARQAQANSRYSLSKMICFNAASSIVDQHSKLVASGNYTLLLFRNDIFRAALSICHNIHVSQSIQNELALHNLGNSFLKYVESALAMLEAYGLVASMPLSGNAVVQKQQAIDRVARQYFKVRASQEDLPQAREKIRLGRLSKASAVESAMPALNDAVTPHGVPILPLEVLQENTTQESSQQFEEYYFGDPSAWTFDNLWTFDPLDLPEI